MNKITILHLSDTHFRKTKDKDNNIFCKDVQEKLLQAIKSHTKEEGNPGFIAITGDIAFSGKKNEYDSALNFFKKLKAIFPEEVEFLPVPGNHDVDRQKVKKLFSLHKIVQHNQVTEFLEKKEHIKDFVNVKFKSYRRFSEQINPGLYGSKKDYFWVKDFPEKGISFLGLNSAWASEGNDRFNIALGYPQVMAALEKSKLPGRVVLMHHPPINWLKDMETGKTRVELFKNCQLLLHGHNHSDYALAFIDPSNSITCLGANASYTNDKDGFIGFQFIAVHFLTNGTAVKVTVWPYIFDERRNKFVPDRERWESQAGEPYFVIKAVEPSQQTDEPSPHLQIPPKYREWVQYFHSKMNIERLDPNEKAFLVPLPQVYIPLETANPFFKDEDKRVMEDRSNKNRMARPGKESKHKEPPFIDIEKLVGRKKCILLRGAAGMGKTTLVKHLAYIVTQNQGPGLLRDYLPVVVFLKKIWPILQEDISYKKTGITFESLLQKYLETVVGGTLSLEEVKKFLARDRALFLLDGLDEVPEKLRRSLVDLVAKFRMKYVNNIFLLTGRPHGIDAGVKQYFGEFLRDIEYLDEKKVSDFINKWLQEIARYDIDCAEVNAADMISDIQLHEHASLFTRNPLLLTALCIFYLESDKRIPEQRAELYDRIMANFLCRRFHDPLNPEKAHRIDDYLKHLAFRMQEQNLKNIDVGKAKELLREYFPRKKETISLHNRKIDNLFTEIEPCCGLLKRPGEGELEFFHPTFQEFMAARHMLYTDTDYKKYLKKIGWHETFLLYTGLISRDQNKKAHHIVKELLNHPRDDADWFSRLWLLGAKVLRDFQPYKRENEVVTLARKKMDIIIGAEVSLEEHFEAGEILGELGDPHIKSTPIVPVEAGEFTRGANKYKWEKPIRRIYLDQFMIGKYPVTNEEFEAFIREGGYGNKDSWTLEGWTWKEKKNISEPLFRHDRKWNGPNFPVVGISWYEACAYAKWLSKKTGDSYVLPTEAQWEKAARGINGSPYPWGNDFDKNLCNTYEVKLNRTNPVGIFPNGKSPYGCFDMSGNVWEWCWDWYDANYYKDSPGKNPQGPSKSSFRVIRGGSWFNGAWRCRGAFRDYEEPGERLYCVGFRLVKLEKKPEENKKTPKEKPKDKSKSQLPGIDTTIRPQHQMNSVKKILILSANPKATPRLRLDEEVREIEEGLRRARLRDRFKIQTKWAVRLRDLRRALLDVEPNIVHFTGHGKGDGLLLEDELGFAVHASAKALSRLFELFSAQVECVILNACYSETQAAAISKHIDYVIGMRKEIEDKAAIEFAVGFYDALGAGRSVEEAFKFGCNAILQVYPDLPEHLIPVLKNRDM